MQLLIRTKPTIHLFQLNNPDINRDFLKPNKQIYATKIQRQRHNIYSRFEQD